MQQHSPISVLTMSPHLQSIFHISYLRGLFPDKHFKSMNIDNLGELPLGGSKELQHMTCWASAFYLCQQLYKPAIN